MKSKIKSIFNLMFDYANENDLVEKNYARTFNISDNILKEVEERNVPKSLMPAITY